ncbi:MAG: amidohydrolase [Bacteroidales bacterium]
MNSQKFSEIRAELHSSPEYSHKEEKTALIIERHLKEFSPDELYTNIGGYGVIAGFKGEREGDSLMFRCEMDAVPTEKGPVHLCGHDGHMAVLIGLAEELSINRNFPGKVWLFFQPAEEVGEGASLMVAELSRLRVNFDYAFALHNKPKKELNKILMYKNVYAAASVGMELLFTGSPSHAAYPEQAANPTFVILEIVEEIKRINSSKNLFSNFALGTVINVHIGDANYGVTPGTGAIRATLRAYDEMDLNLFCKRVETFAKEKSSKAMLNVEIAYHDRFPATINNAFACSMVEENAKKLGMNFEYSKSPERGSEDFAHFASISKACFFDIGNGFDGDDIHREGYKFNDSILESALRLYYTIIYK